MARPKKYTKAQLADLVAAFEEYIQDTPIPIIAEFAYRHDVSRSSLYDYDEFSTLLKKCIDKKEAALERQALDAQINTTMAIFSLKQLGWKDKHDVEHTGAVVVQFDRDDERL